ncbi:MAG TPA: hypothetical protein VGB13_06515, partial [Candidatus Krumholzibacteria bacterium]
QARERRNIMWSLIWFSALLVIALALYTIAVPALALLAGLAVGLAGALLSTVFWRRTSDERPSEW